MSHEMNPVEESVRTRYSLAAHKRQESLCCPVSFDPKYLKVIPEEVLQKDYGCGDPSRWIRPGDTVLDLGSGGGKICFIAAQAAGPTGRVIGVDINDDMLALAQQHQPAVAKALGYDNIEFRKGMIQDLRLDLTDTQAFLRHHPVHHLADLQALRAHQESQRRKRPLVVDESVDIVVSNCVLNLVRTEDKTGLFTEIYRVLKTGGRAAISDIVCDEDVPAELGNDPELWSGCISGAYREDAFLEAFENAGFFGIQIVARDVAPWRVVRGLEFRSVSVTAYKGKQGPCLERHQAVLYPGPWKRVEDDDGHVFHRGKRMAVCEKTFKIMTNPTGPYGGEILGIEPSENIPLEAAQPFNCKAAACRHPRQTRGTGYNLTANAAARRTGDECCGT